jgi:NADH:ubiquinone oxidoreductase subunit H
MRGVAQTVSYEIRLAMILLRFLCIGGTVEVGQWLGATTPYAVTAIALPLVAL